MLRTATGLEAINVSSPDGDALAPRQQDCVVPRSSQGVAELFADSTSGSRSSLENKRQRRGLIARGLGRSYGDAAQCAGGTIVSTAGLDQTGPIDPSSGTVVLGAGVSLHQAMREFLPRGWFVPVSPGTRHVTVGGAIAADIHGKNHHLDGSFCRHVPLMTLVSPDRTRQVGPDMDPTVFWATAGGMGLTGVVTEATVRLLPVQTSWMSVDTERFDDLDGVMARMEESDDSYRYSVAWVDGAGRPGRQGRAILARGDHAPRSALPKGCRRHPTLPDRPRLRVPRAPGRGFIGRTSVTAFNELWFRKAPRRREGELVSIGAFFHPLDGVDDWNLLYGPRGFVQVPVRRRSAPSGRGAHCDGASGPLWGRIVLGRAQTVRSCQPGSAFISHRGVDAGSGLCSGARASRPLVA